MPTTYSTNLAISLIATGEEAGNWGTITNTNLGTLIEQAISGYVSQAITDGADTVISISTPSGGAARNMSLQLTGTLSAPRNLIVPANRKLYFIYNNTSGGHPVTVKVSGQTGVSVPNGRKMVLVSNGTDVVQAVDYTTIAYAESFVPLGSSVPTNGVYLPSANTVGVAANTTNVMNLTSGGIQVGSPDGGYQGAGTINATGLFVNGSPVGTSGGTVTSVTGTGTVNGITLTGTGTGAVTLTLGGTLGSVNLTSQVAGILPVANGGTGQSNASNAINALLPLQTNNGGKFLTTNGSAVSWATVSGGTGTVTSVELSAGTTGLTISGGSSQTITTSGTFILAGNLAVANGGTGATATTGTGSNVLNNGPTLISPILGTPASGTLTNCTGLPIGGGTSGTLATSRGGTNLTSFTSGGAMYATSASVLTTGTLPVGSGGTGVTSSTGTGNVVLSTSPTLTTPVLGTPSSGTLTNCTGLPVSTGISGLGANVATFLATPSSANLAAAVTGETGSGALVFATSPVLTTPALGTPSSGNLSNCTADGTDVVGFRNIPQTTSTTLAASSVGKHHYVSTGVTINTGVFTAGDAFMIVNSSAGNITITQGASVTLRLAGTATTGSRTLAQKGIASVLCVASGEFIVSGVGVT